jgi:chemotaxis protein CheD
MQHVVGIAEMKITKNPDDSLITHALGSCLGVTVHDPVTGVGGMIHLMLPMSKIDKEKARKNPSMFVDTGIPELFRHAYALGAKKEHITLKVAGGAKILDAANRFNIGERNYTLLRKILWKNNVLIDGEDVGGSDSRTLSLSVRTGAVTIRTNGQAKEL